LQAARESIISFGANNLIYAQGGFSQWDASGIWRKLAERLQLSSIKKPNGKRYRYYVLRRTLRFGAGASGGTLPADPIEQMVLEQVHAALNAPEVVQSVWDS